MTTAALIEAAQTVETAGSKRKEVPVDQNGTSNKHSRIETED